MDPRAARPEQGARHRRTHQAEADEAHLFDLTHLSFPLEPLLSAPTGVPGRANLHGAGCRFNARAAGDAEFESDLGNLTVETVRGVTHADIPRPDLPGFEDVDSAFSAWGDWGAFVISHVRAAAHAYAGDHVEGDAGLRCVAGASRE